MIEIVKLLPGENVTGTYLMKKLEERNETYFFTFEDSTGSASASLYKEFVPKNIGNWLNTPVKVTGFVDLANGKPHIKIITIEQPTKEELSQVSLVKGLTETETCHLYNEIRELIAKVNHIGYRELLNMTLKDCFIKQMAERPASLSAEATFAGGLLYKTVIITKIAFEQAKIYDNFSLGIYQNGQVVDTDLLLTAGLLHGIGKIREYTSEIPFKKTELGYLQGPRELTMQTILACRRSLRENGIEISDEEHARLSSVITSTYHENGLHSVTLEGTLLNSANLAFKKTEAHMASIADAKQRNVSGFVYSYKHGGYIQVTNEESTEDTMN